MGMMGDEGGARTFHPHEPSPPSSPIISIVKAKGDLRPVLNEDVIRNEESLQNRCIYKVLDPFIHETHIN